ncbi:MAG: VirB4 family type IV secretion system protein [Acidimicrobiales bacterium]
MSRPAHQTTTRNLGAAYPFATEPGLGAGGVLIGRDLIGGSFCYDPFRLYQAGLLTNPNMVVLGQIGRGKSAFVKSYLWRQAAFGRRAWVVDPKGEYGPLARAWGVEPLSLRPGGSLRLNPLDAPATEEAPERRRAELLCSLASASLGRPLMPSERTAVELAVDRASIQAKGRAPTLPSVVEAMLVPTKEAALAVRTDVAGLAADGRQVALELRRLVAGDMRGMFDGPTTAGLDLGSSLVVLDLSAVFHSAALEVLMTCATAWMQAALAVGSPTSQGSIVVVDEAWAILANLAVARWFQATWKLSRAWGVANVAVLHRLSDLTSVGAAGSEQVGLAEGLLSDSETRVIYAQPTGEVAAAGSLLGLSDTESELIPHLGRGVALWKVGHRSFLVQHLLGPSERALVDTDGALRQDALQESTA